MYHGIESIKRWPILTQFTGWARTTKSLERKEDDHENSYEVAEALELGEAQSLDPGEKAMSTVCDADAGCNWRTLETNRRGRE